MTEKSRQKKVLYEQRSWSYISIFFHGQGTEEGKETFMYIGAEKVCFQETVKGRKK